MKEIAKRVEFVSYDGEFPNLCRGTLVLRIDGTERSFPRFGLSGVPFVRLVSGGEVRFDGNWDAQITSGPWSIEVSDDLRDLHEEIEEIVNENIKQGCCGGCV